MIVIIAGTRPPEGIRKSPILLRRWNQLHLPLVYAAVKESGYEITKVVSGKAQGFDTLGEEWADDNQIEVLSYPAMWRDQNGVYNEKAGFDRNQRMATVADGLIAVWNGKSGGTWDMIKRIKRMSKPYYVKHYADSELTRQSYQRVD